MPRNQWQKIAINNTNKLKRVGASSFIGAAQEVTMRSPVDKGVFINNWFTEVNGVTSKTTTTASPNGSDRLKEALQKALRIKLGDNVSYANALPYAVPLEYGHSEKSPQGMVRITVGKWEFIVDGVARKVKYDKSK